MKLYIKLFCLIFLVANSSVAQKSQILTSGVLSLKDGVNTLDILNLDKTPYLKISKKKDGDDKLIYNGSNEKSDLILNSIKKYYPYYNNESVKYKTPLPRIAVRAIYPDYNIYVFDSEKMVNGYYKIFINGKWKLIKANNSLTYENWDSFIRKAYIKGGEAVYQQKNSKSGLIKAPKNNSYKIIAVDNDWLKVECSKECEGCDDGKTICGWIKWRTGKTILIDLYYSC